MIEHKKLPLGHMNSCAKIGIRTAVHKARYFLIWLKKYIFRKMRFSRLKILQGLCKWHQMKAQVPLPLASTSRPRVWPNLEFLFLD